VIRDANQWDEGDGMASDSVRYIVDDVAATLAFYCDELDFHHVMHPASTFAILDRGELRLVLSAPSGQGGGGHAIPDGAKAQPGGWNRFLIEVARHRRPNPIAPANRGSFPQRDH
jgi:catechol 2,3-dioxygenase-like lactoylglutathione lyase family enzyme